MVGEKRRGACALIVACPSAELIPSLVSHPGWERFYDEDGDGDDGSGGGSEGHGDRPPCVVHMAPAEVLRSVEYQAWSRRFGAKATHMVVAQPFCSPHTHFQVVYFCCVGDGV